MRRDTFRIAAIVLVPAQVLLGMPVALTASEPSLPSNDPLPVRGSANRALPVVSPPAVVPAFSGNPTPAEVFRARVFSEPLVPLGSPTPEETRGLSEAISAYVRAGNPEDLSAFSSFLEEHSASAWRPSLLTNLGGSYRRTGYFSRALTAQVEAWQLAKGFEDAAGRAVAGIALGELAELHARLGHLQELEDLLASAQGLPLGGPAAAKVAGAKQALAMMKGQPQYSYRCGPLAVGRVLKATGGTTRAQTATINGLLSTERGTNLSQLKDLAESVGLKAQAAFRRTQDAAFPTPAVVHWRAGHFAALVRESQGRYLVSDPTFGEETWVSRQALRDETTGYVLLIGALVPEGWRPAKDAEARNLWGKGIPVGTKPNGQGPNHPHVGGGPACGAMATYRFNHMLASLRVDDIPVGYDPPRGPAVRFQPAYLQREQFMPAIPYFSNLGPRWTFDWLSWVEYAPSNPEQTLKLFERGGGLEELLFDATSQTFGPDPESQTVIVRTSSSPVRYERRLPDGRVDVYAVPDTAYGVSRRVFLSESRDAQGNALKFVYDELYRLVALSDAVGQVTTLTYNQPGDPYKITQVMDPFGRSARISYDSVGRVAQITDVLNLASAFTYTADDFMTSMTTPYGTTRFSGDEGTTPTEFPPGSGTFLPTINRSLEATDPTGGTERLEFWNFAPYGIPAGDPPATVPPEALVLNNNSHMNGGLSLFWDKRAMALAPGDHEAARTTHWAWSFHHGPSSSVPMAEKAALESRVWLVYPNQPQGREIGPLARPSLASRVLDDGTFQNTRYEYNRIGKVTKQTDPVGRETIYVWGTGATPDPNPSTGSGMDLLQIKQKRSGGAVGCDSQSTTGCDLVASYTYNSQHLPLTTTDAAGQVTTYTYTPTGQVATIVTPPRGGLTLAQRTTTYTYFPDTDLFGPGRLQTATGPLPGATTNYSYDGYGRVRTTTDPDGHILAYDYDALDRPTKTTYPDLTFEETTYNRLDAEGQRDRQGRWTRTFHDALRRKTAVRDRLGRTTIYDWCTCGSLDKVIDPSGNVTRWEQDTQGRMIREIRADGAAWHYTYENTTSRLKQRKDPKNQIANYEYFLDDNQKRVTYAGAVVPTAEVSRTYDSSYSRVATKTDGTGTTTYSYNPITATPALGAGDLASVDGPLTGDTVSYSYDELRRLAGRGLPGFVTNLSYDALGRLTTAATPVGNFVLSYEGTTARPLTLSYPNNQASQYTYFPNSGDHRLQQIKHLAPGGATISKYDYTYTAVGNIVTWSQQVGANPAKLYTLGYDAADQLITAKITGPTPLPVPSRFAYAYDAAENRAGEQLDDSATAATHNNRNQLSSRQPGGALLLRGTLNEAATVTVQGTPAQVAADNTFVGQAQVPSGASNVVVAATDPSGNTRTNTYQVTEAGSTTTYTHDANGNLIDDGTRTFEWDAEDRLTAVKQGAVTLAGFVYDGLGRRVQKIAGGVTTTYVHDGDGVIEERLSTGGTLRYIRGPGIDQHWAMRDGNGTVTYFLADHLGSVVQTTSSAGSVVLARDYDPYGTVASGAAQSGYAFTGREWDSETNLYYYRARYYDPKIGRFLSEDPIGLAGGLNLFAYVENSPASLTDPFGLAPGDKRFGLPDEFWRWAHKKAMEATDLTKKEAQRLFEEWKRLGKPGPDKKGIYGPRRGGGGGANSAAALVCIVNPELCAELERSLSCVIKNDPGPVPPGTEGYCTWKQDGWRSWYLDCGA